MIEQNQINFKNKWMKQEQDLIEELVVKEKIKSWKIISKIASKRFPGKIKTPKQCRDRFTNYIKFKSQGTLSKDWTQEQSSILFEKYLEIGSRWIEIGKYLPKKQENLKLRSENTIKNHFYGSLRKLLRKINLIVRENSKKQKKPILEKSILKLLDIQVFQDKKSYINDVSMPIEVNNIWKLKYDLLKLAHFNHLEEHQQNKSQILDLACRLQKFKSLTRFSYRGRSNFVQHVKRKSFPPLLSQIKECKQSVQTKNDSCCQSAQQDLKGKYIQDTQKNRGLTEQWELEEGKLFQQRNQKVIVIKGKDLEFQLSDILKIEYQPSNFQFYEQN